MNNKCCNNCMIGKSIKINDDILCMYKGVVSRDYYCSRFKKMPISYNSVKMNKCIDCTFFNLRSTESNSSDNIGLCQLFSVRYFDGDFKKACSKFSKREKRDVS